MKDNFETLMTRMLHSRGTIDVERTPLFFADVHLHAAEILQVRDAPAGTGWGAVPTPMF